MPYSHTQALEFAVAEAGAGALQAALGLGLGGRQGVALLHLDIEAGQPFGFGSLGHQGASLRLGAGPHREPHRVALGQPLRGGAERLALLELLQIRQLGVVGQHLLESGQVLAAQPGVDGQGGAFAAGHRMDGRAGAAAGVAGHEQAGVGGAAGEPVGIHVLPADLERRHRAGVAVLRGEDDGGLAGRQLPTRWPRRRRRTRRRRPRPGRPRSRGRRRAWSGSRSGRRASRPRRRSAGRCGPHRPR